MGYEIIEAGSDSFLADTTAGIAANVRVKLTSGRRIALASGSETEIGVTKVAVADNKTPVEVRLRNAPGSVLVQCSGDFAIGATVKRQANGQVGSGGGGADYGIAASTGSAGDVAVIYPL